jgi:hypothetical protein
LDIGEECFEDEEELPSGIHKSTNKLVETINIVVHVRMCKSVEAAKNDDYVLHVCGV